MPSRPLAAILWDNDGVLVDSEWLFFEANRDYFAQLDVALSEEDFYRWYLCQDKGFWHHLRERGYLPEAIEAGRRARNGLYTRRLLAADSLHRPGMRELVHSLSASVRQCVVTSACREHFDIIHRDGALAPCFEFVLTAECYAASKPSPEPYLQALSRLGIAPGDAVAVEDSPRGLQAAVAAGLRCIVLRTLLTRWHDFSAAFRVVASVDELAVELRRLSAPGVSV